MGFLLLTNSASFGFFSTVTQLRAILQHLTTISGAFATLQAPYLELVLLLTNFAGWTITSFLIYIIYRSFEWQVFPRPLGKFTKTFITMPFITYGSLIVAGMLVGPNELKIVGPFMLGIPILIGLTKVWFGPDQNIDSN